jgi:hypothetical protein
MGGGVAGKKLSDLLQKTGHEGGGGGETLPTAKIFRLRGLSLFMHAKNTSESRNISIWVLTPRPRALTKRRHNTLN